jgi:hypothetical protein
MKPEEELQQEIERKFLCPEKFSREIERMVSESDELNHITAITEYCETHNIDIEAITKLISDNLKERIRGDALRLNYIKRTSKARLPL